MSGQHLFEYAVVRIVPRVEREEFLNVGVVLYCASKKFLQSRIDINGQRLAAFAGTLDIEEVELYLDAFKNICLGSREAGSDIALLPPAERFRWLTATRSTVVQVSRVHPGLCADPAATLERLFIEMVL